jgi:chloramphenicol-sensitive protein RarD
MSLPDAAPEAIIPATDATLSRTDAANTRNGLIAGFVTYTMWGFLPLLFRLLDAVGSVLIVAERTLWSLVLLGIVMAVTRKFGEVRALFSDWRKVRFMLASAVLLGINWLLYVWAVESGQVLEASLGYFINPLVNVATGMLLLGERQNRWQTVSICIAIVGIVIQGIGLGGIPYIALGLALTFGFYGYFRKTAMLGPATGLFAETAIMAPVALAYVGYTIATTGAGPHSDPYLMTLLILTGPATAVPLLLFAFAVQRLRLTTMGMLQYVAPTFQFLVAIVIFKEELSGLRLLSFCIIWLSLIVFTVDGLRQRRKAMA